MRRLPLALALAAALVLSAAASARTSADIRPIVFNDQTGDAGTAPDVATVSVTNDAQGTYTFDVTFATPLVSTSFVDLYLDTDLNPATGDVHSAGADYVIEDRDSDHTFGFYKWDGTQFSFVNPVTVKVSARQDLKGLELVVGGPDIGASTGFNFFVESVEGDGSAGHFDDAPSGVALWQYTLQKPLALSVVAGRASSAKAGGTWILALAATRSDTGNTVGSEGTVVCKATSGSTSLIATQHGFVSVSGGSIAACGFKVPKSLKHRLLHGTITVSYGGVSVTRSFTTKAS
jgi:hypothetical protein